MFSGELSVFLALGVKKSMIRTKLEANSEKAQVAQQANQKLLKMNPSPFLLAIPAACDFTGTTLMFIALTMVPASVYQMMRGFVNVVTPLFSIIFLKKK